MMFFDRVEERQIKGKFIVFAINEIDDQAYPLKNVMVQTSGVLDLSISSYPEIYIYRGKFKSEEELQAFQKYIVKLVRDANEKNNSIIRG